ncbi:transmembrane protein 91-like [Corythoichthys intestinalis]|uniref:transmembrane protein 91-like n=1 Tax=Corythoichthys intestinalis TaxID=161448 RepID=UPI0025A61399|nr:transmembrane protein 91-like [Corythoichthys intestinalis]
MERGQTHTAAPSYLAWSILNTLCCCLPLGIAAIVFSSKVQNANATGNSVAAADASKTAKILNILALVCGLICISIFIAVKVIEGQQY